MAGQKWPHLQSPEFEVRLGRPFMIALRAWNEFCLHVRCSPAPLGGRMKRREFITLLGGAAVAWPLAAGAQQSERVRRIAVLTAFNADVEAQSRIAAFQQELEKLGWSEGRNIIVESRFGGGDSGRVRTYAAELLRMAPDVILAESTHVMLELRQATRTVPIVFVNVADPIERGFVSNLARSEGNITGFTNI